MAKGGNYNPTGKGGFGDNPQNRGDGSWDKTKVFSYQYRRFMNMSVEELKEYAKLPEKDRTVVEDLAYKRVIAAQNSLKDVKEITDRTEGKPMQSIELDTKVSGLSDAELEKIAGVSGRITSQSSD